MIHRQHLAPNAHFVREMAYLYPSYPQVAFIVFVAQWGYAPSSAKASAGKQKNSPTKMRLHHKKLI